MKKLNKMCSLCEFYSISDKCCHRYPPVECKKFGTHYSSMQQNSVERFEYYAFEFPYIKNPNDSWCGEFVKKVNN